MLLGRGVRTAFCGPVLLSRRAFPTVLLDEASQMTEPSSLLTIARFAARRLLAVGDPLQLPPTLTSSPASGGQDGDGGDGGAPGLERTLFERLAALRVAPVMLRRQYRCVMCATLLHSGCSRGCPLWKLPREVSTAPARGVLALRVALRACV